MAERQLAVLGVACRFAPAPCRFAPASTPGDNAAWTRRLNGSPPYRRRLNGPLPYRRRLNDALLTICLLLATFPATALAHQMNIYATVEGKTIRGEVYFRGRVPAQNVTVRATDAGGTEIGQTTTDERGNFALPAAGRGDYRLVAHSADGHSTEPFTLPAALFVDDAADPADSRQVEALRAEIDLLREQVIAYQQRTRVRDVLGGIGWIVGLTGIAYYYLGVRRKLRHG
jgi:nickel transport protein